MSGRARIAQHLGRRAFLGGIAGASGAWLLGCGDDAGGPLDAGHLDAVTALADAGQPVGLSKPPFTQILGPGSARLRFETRLDHAVGLRLEIDGDVRVIDPTRSPQILEYQRRALTRDVLPDEPGLHVVHEALLEALPPGAEVRWTVEPPDAEPVHGRFRAAPDPGDTLRIGWLADTMWPTAGRSAQRLAGLSPDLVLHGGDITYQTSPLDTWNGMMAGLSPLSSRAPIHFALGNHELEDQDEVSVQYERLFAGQGDVGATPRYFALTYGSARVIFLDTETGMLADMDAPQLAWLDAELDRVAADPVRRVPIVAFHRPTYSLSRHAPRETVVRDALHARFRAHGVKLVLAGHVHAYERFEVDGVTYWVDGGGGAALYDPDQRRDEVETWRPGESALRQSASRSHGVTVIDVEEEGLVVRRLATDDEGAMQDEVRIDLGA